MSNTISGWIIMIIVPLNFFKFRRAFLFPDIEFVIQMGIAAIVHLYVFPSVPYKRGERCVRNVAVMTDYASLGAPPDPEEVRDCERSTRVRLGRHDEREKRLNFPQSVRDVVFGSSEIVRYLFFFCNDLN